MPVRYQSNDVLIEYFGDRLGRSEVRVNGKTVAQGRKLGKLVHDFTVLENGEGVAYQIIKHLDTVIGPVIDILRGTEPVVMVEMVLDFVGDGVSEAELEKIKKERQEKLIRQLAREKLANYELREAEAYLRKEGELNPHDGETCLLLACVYSMTERAAKSVAALDRAVALDPALLNDILVAEGLAYTRLQPVFEDFRSRHYPQP